MTQTVLTADSPDSRQPAYTDRQQTAGHPGPGGGGVAGECPGLLTWRGGAVTRPNIDGSAPAQPSHQLGAEETGQKLTYKRRIGQTCHGCGNGWKLSNIPWSI